MMSENSENKGADRPRVSIGYETPDLARDQIRFAVTLPTFRRPEHLHKTLVSLQHQKFPHPFAIVVMENDTGGMEGAEVAQRFFEERKTPGLVVLAHDRGNCHAYNAGWNTVLETFPNVEAIAVIDDDEVAGPDWLSSMERTMTDTGADIVGGPQRPVFSDKNLDRWMAHPVFKPAYKTTGAVPILYSSGNVMIARKVLDAMPQPFLDPLFNFIGGGDADFYSRCRAVGFKFAWCEDAPVFEPVPDSRTEPVWLGKRSRREGAISAMLETRRNPGAAGRLVSFLKSVALLGVSPFRMARLWRKTGSATMGMHHPNVAFGRFIAVFGSINEQYRTQDGS